MVEKKVLIEIILVVLALVILLIFLPRLLNIGQATKEACHNSIVWRALLSKGGYLGDLALRVFPLKCKTNKVCISKDRNCDETFKGEEYDKVIIKDKEDIMQELAGIMYDCYWMTGEGKLNYMPHKVTTKRYCLICSRIAFSEDIQKEEKENKGKWNIPLNTFASFLDKEKVPGTRVTYSEYFSGQNKLFPDGVPRDAFIDVTSEYASTAQFIKIGEWDKIVQAAGTGMMIVGGALVIAGSGGIGAVAVMTVVGTTGGIGVYQVAKGSGEYIPGGPEILPFNENQLSSLGCYRFETEF